MLYGLFGFVILLVVSYFIEGDTVVNINQLILILGF